MPPAAITTLHRHDHRFAEHDDETLPAADSSGLRRASRPHPFVRCAELIKCLDRDGKGTVALPNDIVGDRVEISHEAKWIDRNGKERTVERSEVSFSTHEQAALALLWKLEDELILAAHRPADPAWTKRVLSYLLPAPPDWTTRVLDLLRGGK